MKLKIFLLCLSLITTGLAFSQQTTVKVGSSANDGSGDNLRNAFIKVNQNDFNQVLSGTASGTDTYTVSIAVPSPGWTTGISAPTAYTSGARYTITFTNANTGAATLNINSIGVKDIKKPGNVALSAGDIKAGGTYILVYNGTYLQLLGDGSGFENPMTTAGDLLIGGASGTPTRLAAGSTSGHVLTSNGSGVAPSWQASSGGSISGLTTDLITYATSSSAIGNSGLKYATGGAASLRPSSRLLSVTGANSGTTEPMFYNHGKLAATDGGNAYNAKLLAMPKGFVNINWSLNMANNWVWDNVDQRAEPYDNTLPMIDWELGGEGLLGHYTAPGGMPSTSFHEIVRFGQGLDGLSGHDQFSHTMPFNQFKTTIYAGYQSSTTPPAATDEKWWGGSGNVLEGVLNPLMWLHSEEQKGSGYNINEFARFETNSNTSTAYPAFYFQNSEGTFGTKVKVSTNKIVGRFGSNIFDGSAYQGTAAIEFVARGSISTGNAAQSMRFNTSSSNTAAITTKFEINHDKIDWTLVPLRFNYTGISTVPDYSGVFSSPVLLTSTIGHLGHVSTSTGGLNLVGFSTTSTASSAIPLVVSGVLGATAPTAPAVVFSGRKHNGTTGYADLAASETLFQFRNNSTVLHQIMGNGSLDLDGTITAGGTTGAQTINKISGTVNFAAGASSLVVTNSLVTANSIVFCVIRTNDTTAELKNVVPAAGSFTIRLVANTTAETSVGFFVVN